MERSTTDTDNELLSFLQKIPLFSSIPRDQLHEIAEQFKPVFSEKGDIICRMGDPGDSMYIIKSGSVGVYSEQEGSEIFIAALHRGEFFGELALLTGNPRIATVKVILDAHLYRLDKDSFDQLMQKSPSIALYLTRHYAHRFAVSNQYTLNEPLPNFFAVMSTHHGLGKSHFIYSLSYHLVAESNKKVLIVELGKKVSKKLENYGLEGSRCPDPELIDSFPRQYSDILNEAWFRHSCGFMVFLLPKIRDDRYWEQMEKNLPLLMDLLMKHFQFVLFSIPTEPGPLDERVLRLCDRVLLLMKNTRDALPEVKEKVSYIGNLCGERLDRIKAGVSHLQGERGIPRDVLGAELGLAETPAVWVHKTASALADKIDTEKRFPVQAPRALARELGRVRLGLVLGAGGARGWAHLGVIKVLEEEGIHIDMIAGSSIGALVGCAYAKTASIKASIKMTIDEFPTKFQAKKKIFDYTIPIHGIIRGAKVLRMMRKGLQNADFLDLLIPLYVMAVDFHTGEEVLIEKGDVSEAVRASMSIPGIMNPALHGGRWMLDGGLLHPVPVDVLIQKGADIIIAVCVEGRKYQRFMAIGRSPSIIDVLSRTISIIHSQATGDFAQKADIVLYPELYEYQWDEFHRGNELMRAGAEVCRKHIDEIKQLIAEKREQT